MKDIVILSATRTAIGAFSGSLAQTPVTELGAAVIKSAVEKAKICPDQVNEVLMGCVLQAGQGQNVARQALLRAGLPINVPATTINMVCGSGLKAILLAAQSLQLGEAQIVVAGGMENMSQSPYLLPQARAGLRMGDSTVVDSMVYDGLRCAINDYHMGITAENIAEQWGISREEQDAFACASQNKAEAAIKAGRFKDEITPLMLPVKGGEQEFSIDEFPRFGTTAEKLSKLRPAFKKDGTVTAGNASGVNDGAAAVVLTTLEYAQKLGLTPMARIAAGAVSALEPKIMGMGPVSATQTALAKAGWSIDDVDLIEANEAFAVQSIAVSRELGFDAERVNVNGGAIALGHPIGASGARILVSLLHEMSRRAAKRGLATLCVGGGQGVALLVENM